MNGVPEKRILWVDDEPTVLTVLGTLLKGYGYEFTQVGSAKEALEMLENSTFDLVGTDVRMPDMDGLEMAKVIKDKHPDIPIVLLSAHTGKEAMDIAKQVGVYAYVKKPFKVDSLLDTIRDALAGS